MSERKGKPIFDPFVEQDIPIAIHEERRSYDIFRECGHCRGTGRRKDDLNPEAIQGGPKCAQCLLGKHEIGRIDGKRRWGRAVNLFAFEISDTEMRQLEPDKQLGVRCEQTIYVKQRRIARIMADEVMSCRRTG